jgi:hypothetical protein
MFAGVKEDHMRAVDGDMPTEAPFDRADDGHLSETDQIDRIIHTEMNRWMLFR